MSEINVVPYIDVMLVMLVVFMATVPLIQQGVEISLPEVGGEPINYDDDAPVPDPLIVTVERNGKIWVNRAGFDGKSMNKKELIDALKIVLPTIDYQVYLRADEHVRYGDVVDILVAIENLLPEGVASRTVGLITAPLADEKNL